MQKEKAFFAAKEKVREEELALSLALDLFEGKRCAGDVRWQCRAEDARVFLSAVAVWKEGCLCFPQKRGLTLCSRTLSSSVADVSSDHVKKMTTMVCELIERLQRSQPQGTGCV